MMWSVLGLLAFSFQEQQPAAAPQPPAQPQFEIVENPTPASAGKSHSKSRSTVVRNHNPSGSKPIQIKNKTHKGIPKFRKPKGRH